MPARRLAARWVLPIGAPAIERGALLISAEGRVISVGPDAAVPRTTDAVVEEFADGILLPGLVNAHTHLELTGLGGYPPDPDFAAWIRRVRTVKAERSTGEFLEAARAGLAACHALGVTTVADTGDSGAVIQALAERGGSGIAYHEVFGPHPAQCAESLAGLQARVDELAKFATGRVRVGVSPHAPYTVSGPLFRAVARWAGAEGLRVAVHVAESAAESELLARGTGPFADAWRARHIPPPEPLGRTPVAWLNDHDVLGSETLCIHVVRADDADRALLSRTDSAVAHCPLSNAAHGHGSARLDALLGAGIRVGVGTDSVMSVACLDLLAEVRAARTLAGLTAEAALRLGTIEAASAVGMQDEVGSLEPGKWGDCVVIRAGAEDVAPAEQVLASGPQDVQVTLLGGRDVYRAERSA
jgi:5-methylthioadenosine/S-adenosylhomocysteine deaminase